MTRIPDLALISGTEIDRSLPETITELLTVADDVCIAIQNVRLRALHAIAHQLECLHRCRIILAHLDVNTLDLGEPRSASDKRALDGLLAFAQSGRLEVRSSGALRWHPDFSVFRLRKTTPAIVCLLGAHYLTPAHSGIDWPLTCVLTHDTAVTGAQYHFESIWGAAHDALPAVIAVLQRTKSTAY